MKQSRLLTFHLHKIMKFHFPCWSKIVSKKRTIWNMKQSSILTFSFSHSQPIVSRNELIAMEVDEEPQTTSPMTVEVEDEAATSNIQADDLATEPLPQIDRAEPWHAQFSSSWLPIITRDIARQQRQVRRFKCQGRQLCGVKKVKKIKEDSWFGMSKNK